jgi:monoamine oxidase
MSACKNLPAQTRREFLRRVAILASGAAASPVFPALATAANGTSPVHVVIVGAGLAGLCAAYELERLGHRVTILEADAKHVGGRTRTFRFSDGLYGEAGAMRIPTRHDLTRRYVREFGLPLRKFVLSNPRAYYFLRGERQRIADSAKLNRLYALRDDERGKSPDDLWSDSVVKALKSLSEPEKKDLTADTLATDKVRAYDQQSLQQLCEAAGLSDEAIELLAVTQGAETLLSSAATEHLREELLEVWTQGFDEIVGGTDRLASAFAARLRSKLQLGCEVVRMSQQSDTHRVAAVYRQRGAERRIEGDRHIIAPAGRIYFAGEHASLTHTWMQGALESGLRAAREMLVAAQA